MIKEEEKFCRKATKNLSKKVKYFVCLECEKKFDSFPNLVKHVREKHEEKFKEEMVKQRHYAGHHKDLPHPETFCELCKLQKNEK